MNKICLLSLLMHALVFPASTLLIRVGLQSGLCLHSSASRTGLTATFMQQRMQSNVNSSSGKLIASRIFHSIGPILWSSFYDKWGHAHQGPFVSEKKIDLLKKVIALVHVDIRDEKNQVKGPDAWQYDRWLFCLSPNTIESSSIHWDLMWRKFPELGICMKAVLICHNEPDKAVKAKKRISRIMKKYGINEEDVIEAPKAKAEPSRVQEAD